MADLLARCYCELERVPAFGEYASRARDELQYRVVRADAHATDTREASRGYWLESPSAEKFLAENEGELLFRFEKDLTTRVQRIRSDLLFLHAAAVGWNGRAILLVGDPGVGKSTLTFGLLERGLTYLSDELAPIALDTLSVHPYPRALWLKRPPPPPYELPSASFESSRGIHVPCVALGAEAAREPFTLGAMFLLEPGVASRREPTLRRISAGEATARLFANILNPGGHPSDGLDAAIEVTSGVPCFALQPADLDATQSIVLDALVSSCGDALCRHTAD